MCRDPSCVDDLVQHTVIQAWRRGISFEPRGVSGRGCSRSCAIATRTSGRDRSVEPGGIVIELYVIAQYGTRISEVAHNLMSAVRYHVEKTLGLPVLAVNVNVQGIHREPDGERH